MNTPTTSRGRKQKPHRASNGDFINGLARDTDGRWRIIGTSTRFSEPDEAKAIARFRELTGDVEAKYLERWNGMEERRERPMTRARMIEWARNLILQTPALAAQQLGIEWLADATEL